MRVTKRFRRRKSLSCRHIGIRFRDTAGCHETAQGAGMAWLSLRAHASLIRRPLPSGPAAASRYVVGVVPLGRRARSLPTLPPCPNFTFPDDVRGL